MTKERRPAVARARALAARAQEIFSSHDVPAAAAVIEGAVRLDPKEPEWRRLSGFYLTCMREYERAQEELDRAVALEPGNYLGLQWRANLAFVQGRYDEALKDLGAMPECYPQNEFRRGLLLGRAGRWGEARERLAALAAKSPAWAELLEAYLAAIKGDWDAAVGAAESAAARPGTLEEAWRPGFARRLFRARRWAHQRDKKGGNMLGRTSDHAGRLFLIGVGMDPPDNMTLAMFKGIEACDIIYVNIASDSLMELMAITTKAEIRPINYSTEESREICADMVMSAVKPGVTVGYLTVGHVMVFGPLTRSLVHRCRKAKVEVKAWPGISSMDLTLASMGLVLGDTFAGFQVFDEQALLGKGFSLNSHAAVAVYLSTSSSRDAAKIREVVGRRLLEFYPASHQCFVIGPGGGPPVPRAVDGFVRWSRGLDGRSQVFIPPVPGGPGPDEYDLAALARSGKGRKRASRAK